MCLVVSLCFVLDGEISEGVIFVLFYMERSLNAYIFVLFYMERSLNAYIFVLFYMERSLNAYIFVLFYMERSLNAYIFVLFYMERWVRKTTHFYGWLSEIRPFLRVSSCCEGTHFGATPLSDSEELFSNFNTMFTDFCKSLKLNTMCARDLHRTIVQYCFLIFPGGIHKHKVYIYLIVMKLEVLLYMKQY